MTHRILTEALAADQDDMIAASPDEVLAVAQQGFFDGIRMAAAIVDDPLTKAKLAALIRNAPEPSPTIGDLDDLADALTGGNDAGS